MSQPAKAARSGPGALRRRATENTVAGGGPQPTASGQFELENSIGEATGSESVTSKQSRAEGNQDSRRDGEPLEGGASRFDSQGSQLDYGGFESQRTAISHGSKACVMLADAEMDGYERDLLMVYRLKNVLAGQIGQAMRTALTTDGCRSTVRTDAM